jgi:hypothetical protein
MEENIIWKRMIYHRKDLGDYYLVSNTGEIKGVKTGKIRKKNITNKGYYYVSISLGSKEDKPCIRVHRAVAETFLNNENNYPTVNHKDGNKLNNHVDNLEWCTYKENSTHAVNTGLLTNNQLKRKIICLNNLKVFDSITDAAVWCNCKKGTILDYLGSSRKRKSAGKHPETKEPLRWMYYEDYLNLYNN